MVLSLSKASSDMEEQLPLFAQNYLDRFRCFSLIDPVEFVAARVTIKLIDALTIGYFSTMFVSIKVCPASSLHIDAFAVVGGVKSSCFSILISSLTSTTEPRCIPLI